LPKVKKIKLKIKKVKKKPELVTPFVRRYGVWRPIIERPVPYKKALEIGIKRLERTLGAALQIRKGEQLVPVGKETRMFRPAKRDRYILVERAPFRLKAPTEVREIIAARKRRRKRK